MISMPQQSAFVLLVVAMYSWHKRFPSHRHLSSHSNSETNMVVVHVFLTAAVQALLGDFVSQRCSIDYRFLGLSKEGVEEAEGILRIMSHMEVLIRST